MRQLLSIVLLITAVLLSSCKEEPVVARVEKGTIKSVNVLSYTFNSKGDSNTKSNASAMGTNVLSPIERKLIAVDTLELGGETFMASLIEENAPVDTKALPTQNVESANIYTFYAYKNSEIKEQFVSADSKTFQVPKDKPTNYGIIFLSTAIGMDNPNEIESLTSKDQATKALTYNAEFNENVCYKSFDRESMPEHDNIDVTFTPVFSRLGIYVPSQLKDKTILVKGVKLVTGCQRSATVRVAYNSNATDNITVGYDNTSDNYQADLLYELNPTDNITYLNPPGVSGYSQQGYYNIIPNGQNAVVSITLELEGVGTQVEKRIDFGAPFSPGKRYTISIDNQGLESVAIEPADANLMKGKDREFKLTATYSGGKIVDITERANWVSTSPTTATVSTTEGTKGLVTALVKGGCTITAEYAGKSAEAKVNVIAVESITLSSNLLNILPLKSGVLTATVIMSDGSKPTTGLTWKINSPNGVVTDTKGNVKSPSPQIVSGNSISNTISLKAGSYYGSTKVTVTYGGISKTVHVNVYRDIPQTSYYQWDAPVGDHYINVWQDDNYNTSHDATQSCAKAPTIEQLGKYLGAGVYWVKDGPPFKLWNDNNIYRSGLLLKKAAYISKNTKPTSYVTSQTNFSTKSNTVKAQHFFLPASGDGWNAYNAINAGRDGSYWTSSFVGSSHFEAIQAYALHFESDRAFYIGHYRNNGFVPMPRL